MDMAPSEFSDLQSLAKVWLNQAEDEETEDEE
jgi:hypothetical protein